MKIEEVLVNAAEVTRVQTLSKTRMLFLCSLLGVRQEPERKGLSGDHVCPSVRI